MAFKPQARISTLGLSPNGKISAWSEINGLVCISHKPLDKSGDDLLFWKSEGKVTGLIVSNENIFVLDEFFGLVCLDSSGELIWKSEIKGGGFSLIELDDRFAVVDSLGRLNYVLSDGTVIDLGSQYSSVTKIEKLGEFLITAHENGEVSAILDGQTIWQRPSRGELGESITSIGSTSNGNLVIGREGYALVPGEEEALELEIWDVSKSVLIRRIDINSRLLVSTNSSRGTIFGFDDGKVMELEVGPNGQFNDEMSILFDCKYPIKSLIFNSEQIICTAWFFIYGFTSSGDLWKVEHQGIPEYIKISLDGEVCLFAGEDQNDWTDSEPIGKLSLKSDLIDIDESELPSWFNDVQETTQLTSEELYSEQQISQHLTEDEVKQLEGTAFAAIEESIDELIGALKVENKAVEQSSLPGTLNIDTDELLSQLDDAIENMAMMPEQSILDELNKSIEEVEVPVANAGGDQRVTAQDDGTAIITLDGSSSYDPQSRIKVWSWIDSTGREISDIAKLKVRLKLGKYQFELRICDVDGNWNSDYVIIIVEE
ncbi:MAG: hypothetical protein P8Q95_08360 [Candidatus Poseidoniaceae archaeon]|nr:hypothetical protein [Candidatus Poseidoniaceae archaeon]